MPNLSEKSILIGDADKVSLNFLVRIMNEQGHFAMGAGSGKEGIDKRLTQPARSDYF